MNTDSLNFMVENNIGISVVCEQDKNGARYALISVNLLGRITFCVCVLDRGYALECLGDDKCLATNFYNIILKNEASSDHLFDVVSDLRRSQIYC